MKSLITGANGFVGGHLAEHLGQCGDEILELPSKLDICDTEGVRDFVRASKPDFIYHLAAQADVSMSWQASAETFRVNLGGTQNLLAAVQECESNPKMLLISSAEVYGKGLISNGTIDESVQTRPLSPYGASKLCSEVVALSAFDATQLRVNVARSFNHIGAGQSPGFVVSSIARQIALAELSEDKTILIGNLGSTRDFLDVKDVVRAYYAIQTSECVGEIFNVCSGTGVVIREVLDFLISNSVEPLVVEIDPARVRGIESNVVIGNSDKLRAQTSWAPTSDWKSAAIDCLNHWRQTLPNG